MAYFYDNCRLIIRAVRIYKGLNQSEVAKLLGVRQETMSRIEKGSRQLYADEWLNFCNSTGISARSGINGTVDLVEKDSSGGAGGFKIPSAYRGYMGSTVRILRAHLKIFEKLYGKGAVKEYLNKRGFDESYMVILNNPTDTRLSKELVEIISKEITLESLEQEVKAVVNEKIHGRVYRVVKEMLPICIAEYFSKNSHLYEVNFEYDLVDSHEKGAVFNVTPSSPCKSLFRKSDSYSLSFMNHYMSRHLKEVFSISGSTVRVQHSGDLMGLHGSLWEFSYES